MEAWKIKDSLLRQCHIPVTHSHDVGLTEDAALDAACERIAELEEENEHLVSKKGPESGFWGRATARALDAKKELRNALLRLDEITSGEAETTGTEPEWIQPTVERFVRLQREVDRLTAELRGKD